MSARILSLATACPSRAWSRDEALALTTRRADAGSRESRQLAVMHRGSGVRQRFLVADETLYGDVEPDTGERMAWYARHAPPLALRAAQSALRDGTLDAHSITHLVTVSCTGFAAPGVDIRLIQDLGLEPTVQRTHVGFMGCHGLLNGLGAAAAFAREPGARVLVCAVELCSLHLRYGWDPERLVSHALFGDGAAALVVGAASSESSPAHAGASWELVARGSCLLPNSTDAMSWNVGALGFEMTLANRVPDDIARHLRPWLDAWLAAHGCSVDDVTDWAIHPGGPRILDAVASCLELPAEATAVSRAVLAEHGNMSSPTVAFVLERQRRLGLRGPCVALAFGPGLAAEALLLRP